MAVSTTTARKLLRNHRAGRGGRPSYSIRVEEVDNEVAVDPSAAYGLAVDRFVALGLLLLEEPGERGT